MCKIMIIGLEMVIYNRIATYNSIVIMKYNMDMVVLWWQTFYKIDSNIQIFTMSYK